jgi:hypothetical protein
VAEQATGTEEGVVDAVTMLPGTPHAEGHNPGRPISWVGTGITIVGFIIGGIAFVPAPHWTIFWIGTAVAIVGCLILFFSKAMNTDWY